MDIIKAYATKNLCYKANQKMKPQGIVVHSTGANNTNLKRYVDYPSKLGKNIFGNHWNTAKPGGRQVCVHAFIGHDKDKKLCVAEILPLDICCWGVGTGYNGSYNFAPSYIQFEICEDNLKNKQYYNEAMSLAAEYCAHLCKQFGLPLCSIVGHCEAYEQGYGSNHSDPEHWMKKFGEDMGCFRERVRMILEESTDEIENDCIEDGTLVSIANDAVYYNGKGIPVWVKTQNWYVKGTPKGDRAVIDKNEFGTNSICSAISVKYLTPVKKSVNDAYKSQCPYKVKVDITPLDIRKGAGNNTAKAGQILDVGVYTIVSEKYGSGASLWGKLKSGVGWISLDKVKKV